MKASASLYESIARIVLPPGILDLFEITNVEDENTGVKDATGTIVHIIHFHLDERDLRSAVWHDLRPNGFTEVRRISDFPIRDRKVVLHIRRRRWLDGDGRSVILPHDKLTADGTSYSKEFADVLKKIFGHLPRTGPFSGAAL